MCVSKVQHMTGRKTGCNRTGFFRFFDFSKNIATGNRKNSGFVQPQLVVQSLGSVRFRSFFQSRELDLRTLAGMPTYKTIWFMYDVIWALFVMSFKRAPKAPTCKTMLTQSIIQLLNDIAGGIYEGRGARFQKYGIVP